MKNIKIKLLFLSLIIVLMGCSFNSQSNNKVNNENNSTAKTNSSDEKKDEKENPSTSNQTDVQNNEQDDKEKVEAKNENTDTKVEGDETSKNAQQSTPIITHNGKFKDVAFNTNKIKEDLSDANYSGPKVAFLTFDDGINLKNTPRLLEILKELGVPATFLPIGSNIDDSNGHLLKQIVEDGHSLGLHSYSHNYGILYPNRCADPNVIANEVNETISVYKKYVGENFDTKVFRYPGGHMTWDKNCLVASDNKLGEMGISWIDWNSMNGDAQSRNVDPSVDIPRPNNIDEAVHNVVRSLSFNYNQNLAVILMHDTPSADITIDSVKNIVLELKSRGFVFGILE